MDINKLDPQRRELLEARFSKVQYQPFENVSFNNGSSGSDSSEISQISSNPSLSASKTSPPLQLLATEKSKTPPPTKGRKRKNLSTDVEVAKVNRSLSTDNNGGNIVQYFGKKFDIATPQRSNPSPNRSNHKVIMAPVSPSLSMINCDIAVTSRATQTDIAFPEMDTLVENIAAQQTVPRPDDVASSGLTREISQLEQQLHAQIASEKKLKEKNARSVELLKEFLVEQATGHKKKTREETMRKRLRLGQFNTVRQGASFVEQWNDGYAFGEVNKKLNNISQQKEELDKQRKYLSKRRPLSEKAAEKKEKKEKKLIDDGFLRPSPVVSLSSAEYHEQDEILRLRMNATKKEEQELQAELEKLERERNIHIRELKRIHNEDQSRYNNHPILHDRYLLLELIGKGGFSEVFKCFDLKDLRYVACKVHQLNKDWKEDKKANYIKHAVREYTIHRSLNHPRIVLLHDVFEIDSNSFVTVLEYCDGNDLDFMLKQYKAIPEKETRAIIMQVVSALKYLNERKPPVIHYDLKPGNILLGSGMMSWEVKLTDFGLSKILPEDADADSMDLTSQGAGTYWYLPPECFVVGKQPPKISSKVDVWSVGIIFYQALYGRKPFGHNLSQASILEQNTILKATNIEFPSKPVVSTEAKNFIRKCLTYKKEERVDVFQLALDPYLKPKKEAKKMEQQAHSYGGTNQLQSRSNLSGDSASN